MYVQRKAICYPIPCLCMLQLTTQIRPGLLVKADFLIEFGLQYMGFGGKNCKVKMIIYSFAMVSIPCLAHVMTTLAIRSNGHTWSYSTSHQPLTKALSVSCC